ncbi:hypothetical protein PTKIN_Ptkin09bG0142400 [Pterospermum kingtungense]
MTCRSLLKRLASLGTGNYVSGLYLNPSSPSGSDSSDSSLPSSSPVYRLLARTGSLIPSSKYMETASSTADPPTLLSLSLPISDSCEISDRRPGSAPESSTISIPTQVSTPAAPAPAAVSTVQLQQVGLKNGGEVGMEKQFFSREFLAVMQEMIRKEVRNYMAGIEQNGLCFPTKAIIRNAVVKRIGITRIE